MFVEIQEMTNIVSQKIREEGEDTNLINMFLALMDGDIDAFNKHLADSEYTIQSLTGEAEAVEVVREYPQWV